MQTCFKVFVNCISPPGKCWAYLMGLSAGGRICKGGGAYMHHIMSLFAHKENLYLISYLSGSKIGINAFIWEGLCAGRFILGVTQVWAYLGGGGSREIRYVIKTVDVTFLCELKSCNQFYGFRPTYEMITGMDSRQNVILNHVLPGSINLSICSTASIRTEDFIML